MLQEPMLNSSISGIHRTKPIQYLIFLYSIESERRDLIILTSILNSQPCPAGMWLVILGQLIAVALVLSGNIFSEINEFLNLNHLHFKYQDIQMYVYVEFYYLFLIKRTRDLYIFVCVSLFARVFTTMSMYMLHII